MTAYMPKDFVIFKTFEAIEGSLTHKPQEDTATSLDLERLLATKAETP